MSLKKPQQKFSLKKKEKIEYQNVSYRLPKSVISELSKHVDEENSASYLVSEIIKWALSDLAKGRK
jgi:hypothetical protein